MPLIEKILKHMMGMQGLSRNVSWLDIRTSGATQGTFRDIRGPQFDNSGVDIAKGFQSFLILFLRNTY